jgi:hypothetical protein
VIDLEYEDGAHILNQVDSPHDLPEPLPYAVAVFGDDSPVPLAAGSRTQRLVVAAMTDEPVPVESRGVWLSVHDDVGNHYQVGLTREQAEWLLGAVRAELARSAEPVRSEG